MRLPQSAHTSQPWRIHGLTGDFPLHDVWALPTPGGRDDFPRLVQLVASFDPWKGSSLAARALWTARRKAGELLGWDEAGAARGVRSVRDRLPADLRDGPAGPEFDVLPVTPLYLTETEWAVENVNRTVHGVVHFGWVADGSGGYRGQMAIYVKRNGLLGTAYMAAIGPFRHLVVYPPLTRDLERQWRTGAGDSAPAHAQA
jgi:hypothetical protein